MSPLEATALAKASKGELTEDEERAQEIANQKKMAAALGLAAKTNAYQSTDHQ